MKKILLIAMVAFTYMVNAQNGKFNLGPQIGIPVGNAGDSYSFVLGADANYMFDIEDKFELGPASALIFYLGKEGVSNSLLLPLAAAGRFNASDNIDVGMDLGFVIGLSNAGNDFYFKPTVAYKLDDNAKIYLGYTGLGETGHFTIGAMFSL